MENTITNVSVLFVGIGLAVFAGSFIFSAGALTVLGWAIFGPMFIGALGLIGVTCYAFVTSFKKDEKKVEKKDGEKERDQKKDDKKEASKK